MPTINRNTYHRPSTPNCDYIKREQTGKYYASMSWRRLRDWHIANHPLCNDCALNGRSVAATEVHHQIPWGFFKEEEDKWKALLDSENLISLCQKCHLERHKHLKRPENFEQTDYYKKIHEK